MNQVTIFDDTVKVILKSKIMKLVEEVAEKFGVNSSLVDSRTNENQLVLTMAFGVKEYKPDTQQKPKTKKAGEITTADIKLGFCFRLKTRNYTIVDFKTKNWKNSVSLQRDDGKRFKIAPETIIKMGVRV
jgi:hypothetical protein